MKAWSCPSEGSSSLSDSAVRSPVVFVKALVSALLLTFFFSRIDTTRFLRILSEAHPHYIIFGSAAYLLSKTVASLRWALLARAVGFPLPLRRFMRFTLIGMFLSLFAPGTLGGDAGRVFYLTREDRERPWSEAAGYALLSVLADRAIGMVILIWIGASALMAFPAYPVSHVARGLTLLAAGVLIVGWLLVPFLSRVHPMSAGVWAKRLGLGLDTYRRDKKLLVKAALLSLIAHSMQTGVQVLLARALDLNLPWSYCFILFPLVDFLSMLPISVSGLGLREGGYLLLLQAVQVSPEKSVACGVLWFFVVLLSASIGGVAFVLPSGRRSVAVPRSGAERAGG